MEQLDYIINHVFLPPKLPQQEDSNSGATGALTTAVLDAILAYQLQVNDVDEKPIWRTAAKMMDILLEGSPITIDSKKLDARLSQMVPGDVLVLHIIAQNAGIIIRRLPQDYSFEAFELAPTTAAVMRPQGRLVRCFPGPAISVSQDRIFDPTCRHALIECITKLNDEAIEECSPVTVKASKEHQETRDSLHPMFVTEMLMGFLRGIGQPTDNTRIYKHTRDEVLWDRTLLPWRRSTRWTLLRVALQTTLIGSDTQFRYKFFMIYFMARILDKALKGSTKSDRLFIIIAKINRRILKLGSALDQLPGLEFIQNVVLKAYHTLQKRWESIESPAGSAPYLLSHLNPTEDVVLTMEHLSSHIEMVARRQSLTPTSRGGVPSCCPRLEQTSLVIPKLRQFSTGSVAEKDKADFLNIVDFELWVENELDGWLQENRSLESSYVALAGVIALYCVPGSLFYREDPEGFSLMVLTLMDLWVALDKCVTGFEPLLLEYETGFPGSVFEPLILPRKKHLERLSRVEQYVSARNAGATPYNPSIFEKANTEGSFAVQYFEQSRAHQDLKVAIENLAYHEKAQKLADLALQKQEYQRLKQDSASRSCEYHIVIRGTKLNRTETREHLPSCRKCSLLKQAESLSIKVHEWPLPSTTLAAKSTVFELAVPKTIKHWRDATYRILVDILTPETSRIMPGGGEIYFLYDFKGTGLRSFIKPGAAGRVQLASQIKEVSRSHYKEIKVRDATNESVCVQNGLRCELFDDKLKDFTTKLLGNCDIRALCTISLIEGPYKSLQSYLSNTDHDSNQILAAQAGCPKGLTQHEFYAFGTLRAGHRLQWRNIARSLLDRVLDFSHTETGQLIAQSIWQVGPFNVNSICRDSHLDLEEEEFCLSLVSALNLAISGVESNWQGAPSARTFTAIAARVLSVSSSANVRRNCFDFLERVRTVTIKWTREIAEMMHECQSEDDARKLTTQCLELALSCHATFDVDPDDISVILTSVSNVSIATECSIVIHDRLPATTTKLSSSIKVLLRRSFRIFHRMEPILRSRLLLDHAGIENTVRGLWAGYEGGRVWTGLANPSDRWITTTTAGGRDRSLLEIHFNILDGTLLVDGIPLSRLPENYENHPSFRRLFGDKILEVVPSSMVGMVFETRHEVYGNQVHFAMYDEELVIRICKQGRQYELVPSAKLKPDFPLNFSADYFHWMDMESSSIEWRPRGSPWETPFSAWHTQLNASTGETLLVRGTNKLLDVKSQTMKVICRILRPIEHANYISTILNSETGCIEIRLPRFNLDFTLRENGTVLESKQFRGMHIDEDQSCGILTGLENKLALRDAFGASRLVIVPDGKINFDLNGDHVQVTIDTAGFPRVKYHQFQIDKQLGRLVDNGSTLSRVYRLYLHALTSHCLPDSLTGRTGTEEALHGLSMASTQSFLELGRRERDALELISELTPKRVFYPKHLKVMQTVQWSRLSPLSQHEDFEKLVTAILEHSNTLQIFQEAPDLIRISKSRGDSHLQARAALRNASFRVDGFGAENFTSALDLPYDAARDAVKDSMRENRTCHIAKMVDKWSPNTSLSMLRTDLLKEIEGWRVPIAGVASKSLMKDLGFSKTWLLPLREAFPEIFCSLISGLVSSDPHVHKYKIMMFFCTLAYSQKNMYFLQALFAFATNSDLKRVPMPRSIQFEIPAGYEPNAGQLSKLVASKIKAFEHTTLCTAPLLPKEKSKGYRARRMEQYRVLQQTMCSEIAQSILSESAAKNFSFHATIKLDANYIDAAVLWPQVTSMFDGWTRNAQFRDFIHQVQRIVDTLSDIVEAPQPYRVQLTPATYRPLSSLLTWDDLLRNPPPQFFSTNDALDLPLRSINIENRQSNLEILLARLSGLCEDLYETSYTKDLRRSADAYGLDEVASLDFTPSSAKKLLLDHLNKCKARVANFYELICIHLRLLQPRILATFGNGIVLIPRLSPSIVLSQLARNKANKLSPAWKHALVQYGVALSELQRAERLVICTETSSAELLSELLNPGHVEWDPLEYPDWLLLELENGILIRQEQAQIAKQMICPSSGSNSIMQLNMGLGKSSVIVPIVAATLADGHKLARVVVLKSLSTQMFQLLVNKLGGILNRRVIVMPISRSLKLKLGDVERIQDLFKECKRNGSVVLVQPEHLLSFELLGLDLLLAEAMTPPDESFMHPDKKADTSSIIGRRMVDTQRWLLSESRDILDESDELLSVRFELIYTMGLQQSIEFSPDRWIIVQNVLNILKQCVLEDSVGLEVLSVRPGAFPRLRVLEKEAGDKLLFKVACKICESGLPSIPIWNLPRHAREIMLRFIVDPSTGPTDVYPLEKHLKGIDSMIKALLLLRGLISGGILGFAFAQKRWRVNYGLDLSRTKLAVPYNAKDSPTARSEFSHPDTAIVLTCLSYYYGGLTNKEIFASFEQLLRSDHAQESYTEWIRGVENLPKSFKQLSGVNLSNTSQCDNVLFPLLRFSKSLIDFYTSNLVFPKEMKEFPHKLSSSGWDIGRDKSHPTTGFSGTNDSRYVLPVAVKQCDLPQQLSTNAAVLDCLLRPENIVDHTVTNGVEVLDSKVLFKLALESTPAARVILDVGAQVLELRNEEVAKKWLSLSGSDALAAIYFDDRNDLCVLSRTGVKELLQVSPYAKQMDRCLVYLDEAHTRGTDLKMPSDYRAIVTIGPDLTKDRLVQACMRMRKLGKGQSVLFCGPREVQTKILQSSRKNSDELIEVSDILSWCIRNTWITTRKSIPLWATQGLRHFCRRAKCSTSSGCPEDPKSILEIEAQALDQRYGFSTQLDAAKLVFSGTSPGKLAEFRVEIAAIRAKCEDFGLQSFSGSSLHEEQERELQPENEREQQVERPAAVPAHIPDLHPSVADFASSSTLNRFSPAFQPAFSTLSNTSAGKSFESLAWPQDLLVTADFVKTVQIKDGQSMDDFLRPVHWIVSGKYGNQITCVVVSPFEANHLLPLIRKNRKVTLHTYAPRLSIMHQNLDDLSFCALPPVPKSWSPPRLSTQINLFAGQLYLRDYEEYLNLCHFLGLSYRPPDDNVSVACDGFINPTHRAFFGAVMARTCRFKESPVQFLRILTSLRRKGQSFSASHMGKLLKGDLVKPEDFEELSEEDTGSDVVKLEASVIEELSEEDTGSDIVKTEPSESEDSGTARGEDTPAD